MPLLKISENKNHGTIPAISHNTNGYPFTSPLALRMPTVNTNQYTQIEMIGLTNAQSMPKYDPANFFLKSFFASSRISFLFFHMSCATLMAASLVSFFAALIIIPGPSDGYAPLHYWNWRISDTLL